ncbi:MAG: Gfo/Idh/MocA family protein [Candidatus Brocadiia bacterium]
MSGEKSIPRRAFLGRAAVPVAAGLASKVFGAPAPPTAAGANSRIGTGHIGVGGMGTGHLRTLLGMAERPEYNVRVAAVCDIYEPRKERAREMAKATLYHAHEDLLADEDVDAVIIATPAHNHAHQALDALEAGKDVYCEKPMTLAWEDARRVAATARRTGRIVRVGVQGASDGRMWRVRRLIEEGRIGKLVWTQKGDCRNSRHGIFNYPIGPATPKTLDWERFLGPAPVRPFEPERYFRWRKYWEYSGGLAGDILFHQLGHTLVAIGPQFPRRVVASGGSYVDLDSEIPDVFHMMLDYPGGCTVVLVCSMVNAVNVPFVFRGHRASLFLEGGQVVLRPERPFREEIREERFPPLPTAWYMEDFLDSVRSRKPTHIDAQVGYRVTVGIDLANRGFRENRAMLFDPEAERVLG